jgi:hypothetical protein
MGIDFGVKMGIDFGVKMGRKWGENGAKTGIDSSAKYIIFLFH